jgi:ABC-type branched-subunit amino acid transport system ATPase component
MAREANGEERVALRVEGFSAGYGSVPVVSEVNLRAEAGKVCVILGPNGAGKSTLLKGIAGLIPRLGGRAAVAGRDVTRLSPEAIVAAGMSYVPQVDNVFPSLTVAENLRMGAYLRTAGVAERMEEVLRLFPMLRQALDKRAGALSGGQRNMLALARGLMLDPHVLLLDEPTAGLAPVMAREVWSQVRLVAEQGTAVVVVEQNVRTALAHSDYAYVLVSGRNRYEAPSAAAMEADLGAMFLGA